MVVIRTGGLVVSDPIHLSFVTSTSRRWLPGRNLAITFAVSGSSGPLSFHAARVTSYIARPNSGDHTIDEGDVAFPYSSNNFFLVNELDVLGDVEAAVVCAFGDSITDGGLTVNGYDGWSDQLSKRLHRAYGEKVSVVNMGIGGNTVVTDPGGAPTNTQPAVQRLDRDVLGISGLTSVVWLEGINDLGASHSLPGPVIEGYKEVVRRLHERGIVVVGATLTPSLWPEPNYDSLPELMASRLRSYGDSRTNAYRKTINEYILKSGLFDSVADMSRSTEDPATGAFYQEFQRGDYLHPNRAGHLAMAEAVDITVLAPHTAKPLRSGH
jgi:lysophospholipase L1-like esterase